MLIMYKTKFPLTSKVKFLGTLFHRYDPTITVNAPELSLNDLALEMEKKSYTIYSFFYFPSVAINALQRHFSQMSPANRRSA